MNKINISFILISDGLGGAEQVVINIIKYLDKSKFNVYLITNNEIIDNFTKLLDDNHILNIGNIYNLTRHALINKIINRIGRSIDLRKRLIQIKKAAMISFLEKNNVELLHSHLMYDLYALSIIDTRHLKIKTVYTLHGFLNLDPLIKLNLVLSHNEFVELIKNCDYVTTVSKLLTKNAIEIIPGIKEKCITVENALEKNNYLNFSDLKKTNTEMVELVFLGGEKKVKGGDILLDALNILISKYKYRNIHLTILGSINKEGTFCQDIINNKTLNDNITIKGFVSPPEHLQYINNSDIVVLPSLTEGLPLVMLEALKLGKCVLASKIPIFEHYIEEKKNGLLFDLTSDSLANTLKYILNNTNLLDEIKRNNKKYSIPYWENVIKQYENVYTNLIGN